MSAESYKNSLQAEMKKTLSQVVGVGDVEVMITLEGEVSKEIAYNETKSGSASSDPASRVSEQTTLSRDAVMVKSSDGTTPYTLEDKYPAVLGVVVVAEGAENSQTKYYIVNAVKTALDVPSHKIVVLPKKSN